jgi:hypothetical protein
MPFGKYPDVPLALARERHAEARKLVATGLDLMAQRKAVKTAAKAAVENSFQSIASLWMEHWQDGKSPRHVEYVNLSHSRLAKATKCFWPSRARGGHPGHTFWNGRIGKIRPFVRGILPASSSVFAEVTSDSKG